jgi:glycosyltransferase involved in cell wall biosynthesis
MELSVIIPTHNRADALPRTLDALVRQSHPADQFEVLVVDDGSTETEREALRKLKTRYGYRFLEKEQGGLASARNFGAEQATGAILWFLDDDVVPTSAALAEHLSSHADAEGPVAVVGSLPFPEEARKDAFIWYLEKSGHYDLYEHPDKYPDGHPPMPPLNGNSSLPRSLFFEIGCYDESFRQYGGEDLEMGHRLTRFGTPFIYNPRAVGVHHHVKRFEQFCVDMERSG